MIQVKSLSFRYPGNNLLALKDINLNIAGNEFVAIMGRNGSGKSTLARLLNGLLLPEKGSVIVDGLDTSDRKHNRDIKKKVGLVMSVPDNQIIAGTVEEDVAFGPENLGLPAAEIRKRVDYALSLVGMQEFRNYPPDMLSGGQKQRVCIAGLLAMRPDYMILDEPVAMLDPSEQIGIIKILRQLHEELNLAVVLVTHSMAEAVIADRIVVLKQGQIVRDDTINNIAGDYQGLLELGIEPLEITSVIHHINMLSELKINTNIVDLEDLVKTLCHS